MKFYQLLESVVKSVERVLEERRDIKINYEEISGLPSGLTSRRTGSSVVW